MAVKNTAYFLLTNNYLKMQKEQQKLKEPLLEAEVSSCVFSPVKLDNAKISLMDKKLSKEALNVEIEIDKEYHLPFLERYCAARKLVLLASPQILKKTMLCYNYLKIGKFIFSISNVDGANFRVKYRVINQNAECQLQFF